MGNSKSSTLSKLSIVDWCKQNRIDITDGLAPDTRIGELTQLAIQELNLPPNKPYSAFINSDNERGKKLNKSDTVEETLKDGDEIVVAPEVSAGNHIT